jgi:NarL family two-component system response regulator LiaR
MPVSSASMSTKIRVVLADDHTVLREATAELVDNQPDMEIVGQAGTGEEIVALTKILRPDIVVMDAAMPRMNGLDATRVILSECSETRILILSAHEDREHVLPLLEAGAIGYLPKTIGLNEFLSAIRSAYQGISVLPPSIASVVVRHLSARTVVEPDPPLTEREIEVLRLVAQGMTNEQVAHKLNLSKRTVEAHLTHIYTKLNVFSRTEAALLAQKSGWFDEN